MGFIVGWMWFWEERRVLRGVEACKRGVVSVRKGAVWSLPPWRPSPEEEFRWEAMKAERREKELKRPVRAFVIVKHENKRLFAEVVDHVRARDLHWLRPFLLQHVISSTADIREWNGLESEAGEESILFDLRGSSDVFLPDVFVEKTEPKTRTAVEILLTCHRRDDPTAVPSEQETYQASSALLTMLREISEANPEAFHK